VDLPIKFKTPPVISEITNDIRKLNLLSSPLQRKKTSKIAFHPLHRELNDVINDHNIFVTADFVKGCGNIQNLAQATVYAVQNNCPGEITKETIEKVSIFIFPNPNCQ
jgi:hypothetical protein